MPSVASAPGSGTTATVPDTSPRTRLHISPFNPELVKVIIPPALLPSATNISFHSIQTFPEKGFGFVELPTMEAEKLRKKLNGSTLRGHKLQIDEAKPDKRKSLVLETSKAEDSELQKPSKRMKTKKEKGVLPAHELSPDRHVKRGWTEPAEKKRRRDVKEKSAGAEKKKKKQLEPSKYTKEPELLFKTVLPPNVAAAVSTSQKPSKSTNDKKAQKKSKETVVHEFSKTTKHATFLKSATIATSTKPATEYVDGKGWVDDDGVVVEPEDPRISRRRLNTTAAVTDVEPSDVEPITRQDISSQPTVAATQALTEGSEEESEAEAEEEPEAAASMRRLSVQSDDEDSESDAESSESDDATSSSDDDSEPSLISEASEDDSPTSDHLPSPSSIPKIIEQQPSPTTTSPQPAAAQPHPLELLYKRPKDGSTAPKLAPLKTSFSFFGAGGDEDEEVDVPPQTPFTRQDREHRIIRSAAPTPDTAAIGAKFNLPWDEGEDDDEDVGGAEGMDVDQPGGASEKPGAALGKGEQGEKGESEFAKWFWENRGENNRAWKRRRREVKKQLRQLENKRLNRRIV